MIPAFGNHEFGKLILLVVLTPNFKVTLAAFFGIITDYNFDIRIKNLDHPYPIPDSNYFGITVDKQKKNVLEIKSNFPTTFTGCKFRKHFTKNLAKLTVTKIGR